MHYYFSYCRFPDHEIQIKKIALEMGFEHISLSSEVMPMLRIVPRGHTGMFYSFTKTNLKITFFKFLIGNFHSIKSVFSFPSLKIYSMCGCLFNPMHKEIC